jgi:hypothetical protein
LSEVGRERNSIGGKSCRSFGCRVQGHAKPTPTGDNSPAGAALTVAGNVLMLRR